MDKTNLVKIEWSNSCDTDDVCYTNGFKQCLWMEFCEAFPLVETTTEATIDLNGLTNPKSGRVAERCVYESYGIVDAQLYALACIRFASDVKITFLDNDTTYQIGNFSFDYRSDDNCLNTGIFSWESAVAVKACC